MEIEASKTTHKGAEHIHPLIRSLPPKLRDAVINKEGPEFLSAIKELANKCAFPATMKIDGKQGGSTSPDGIATAFDALAEEEEEEDDEDEILLKEDLGQTIDIEKLHRSAHHPFHSHFRSVSRLIKLIKIYNEGLRHQFPDPIEDRLFIVNCLWKAVTFPDIQPELPVFLQVKCFTLITSLIKNKYCPLKGKLAFSWFDIFAIVEKNRDSHKNENKLRIGYQERLNSLFEALRSLAKATAWYYNDPDSVAEALHQHFTLSKEINNSYVKESEFNKAMLCMLFPIGVKQALNKYGQKWIDLWESSDKSLTTDIVFSKLFSSSIKNMKQEEEKIFDFEKHVPWLFLKVQTMLNVTVPGTAEASFVSNNEIAVFLPRGLTSQILAARLSISMLGYSPKAITHLTLLLHAIETFYHPSNYSGKTDGLVSFLTTLITTFCKRLNTEKAIKDVSNPSSSYGFISIEESRTFIKTVIPLLEMLLFSKNPMISRNSASCLHELSWIAPQIVSDHFVPIIEAALDPENLTRTHQAPAAIMTMTSMIHPLLRLRPSFILPRILPILENILPGIDPNDPGKTSTTLTFIFAFASCVNIVDTTNLAMPDTFEAVKKDEIRASLLFRIDDVTETDEDIISARELMWTNGPALCEWVTQIIDRMLKIVESQPEQAKSGFSSIISKVSISLFVSVLMTLLVSVDDKTKKSIIKKIGDFLIHNCYPNSFASAKALGRACAEADPDYAYEKLIPSLAKLFQESSRSTANKEIWALHVLGGATRYAGERIIPLKDVLIEVIKKGLNSEDATVRKLSGTLIRRLLRSLLTTYNRFGGYKMKDPVLSAYTWGMASSYLLEDNDEFDTSNIKWHIPTEAEINVASEIVKTFLPSAAEEIVNLLKGSSTASASDSGSLSSNASSSYDKWRRASRILFQLVRGLGSHLSNFEKNFSEHLQKSNFPPIYPISLVSEHDSATVCGSYTREKVIELCLRSLDFLHKDFAYFDKKTTVTLLKTITIATGNFGVEKEKIKSSHFEMGGRLDSILPGISAMFASFNDSIDFSQPTSYFRQKKVQYRLNYGKTPDNIDGVISGEKLHLYPYIMYSSNVRGASLRRGSEYARYVTASRFVSLPKKGEVIHDDARDIIHKVFVALITGSKSDVTDISNKALASFNYLSRRYKMMNNHLNITLLEDIKANNNTSGKMQGESDDAYAARILGSLKLLQKKQRVNWFLYRWSRFSKIVQTIVFSVGNIIETLPSSKQSQCESLVSGIFQEILRCYRSIPLLDEIDRRIRASILTGILAFCERKPHWRRQMMALACVVMLLQENNQLKITDNDAILPNDAWKLLCQSTQSEIIPLRMAAFYSVNQLLVIAGNELPNGLPDEVVKQLTSNQYLKLLTDAMVEDRSTEGATGALTKKGAQWSEGIEPILRFIRGYYRSSPNTTPPMNQSSFSTFSVIFWDRYISNCGVTSIESINQLLNRLFFETSPEEISRSRIVALEISTGILRNMGTYTLSSNGKGISSKHLPADEETKLKASSFKILEKAMGDIVLEAGKTWSCAFRFAACDGDLPWIQTLLEFSIGNLEAMFGIKSSSGGAIINDEPGDLTESGKLAHKAALISITRQILVELIAQLPDDEKNEEYYIQQRSRLTPIILSGLESHFGGIRDFSCILLSTLISAEEVKRTKNFDDWLESVLSFIETKGEKELTIADATLKPPVLTSLTFILALFLTSCSVKISGHIVMRLLPLSIRICSQSNAETAKRAKESLKIAASSLRVWTAPAADASKLRVGLVLNILTRICNPDLELESNNLIKNATWNDRANTLQFISAFCFHHMHLFSEEENDNIQKSVEQSLQDSQLEVQDIAKIVLAGIFARYQSKDKILQSRDRYLKLASTKVSANAAALAGSKRKAESGDASSSSATASSTTMEVVVDEAEKKRQMEKKKLKMRHAGVLGLAAITLASPYDVPEYLPKAVASLARHISDPYPIGECAKTTITKFKQTHQERWQEQRNLFTSDELDDLEESSNASYAYS